MMRRVALNVDLGSSVLTSDSSLYFSLILMSAVHCVGVCVVSICCPCVECSV